MSNSWILVFLFFFLGVCTVVAQDCNITVKGVVMDEGTAEPLEFVNIFIQEIAAGTATEHDGLFVMKSICPGKYHISFSHIGCQSQQRFIEISRDTFLNISLPHTSTSLGTVTIAGQQNIANNQATVGVGRQVIEDNTNLNLSELIEGETGVSLLRNGAGLAKPVVHGLFGNRLPILNNGVAQSGQQWGNDHSPEIDPTAADKVTVIKGANALQYAGGSLGSAVLVEPSRIEEEPHLHGQVNYIYEGNGRGHTINTRIGKYSPLLSWRVNGTYKKYGDRHTADYFLNNTGVEELNFSVQLEKSWSQRLFVDFYGSTFNTTVGVLRGSHIGNLTDLQQALEKEVPFFTEPEFSYGIDAPKQEVAHHLVKLSAKYFISDSKILELVLAGQVNDRKEFDVRRGGFSDVPALSLLQNTFVSELTYKAELKNRWSWKIGSQTTLTDNTNNPETNVLPLIPDYASFKSGLFTTISKTFDKAALDFGIRYDFEDQYVVTFSNTVPREILRYENKFGNISGLSTFRYELAKEQSLVFGMGYGMRNPAINELYSNGLHQGVSGIEVGDLDLQTEKALKITVEHKWAPSSRFSISTLGYYQFFRDYIFLDPQEEFRLTIRGAFPVFMYQQTDAVIYGLDVSSQFSVGANIFGTIRYSHLKGDDVSNDLPLIFMPANNLNSSLSYRTSSSIPLFSTVEMDDLEIEITNRVVFKQGHLLAEQDFTAPPPSYVLFGLQASANFNTAHNKIRFFVKAENIFNIQYRDYLNRQRYFADDLGRSISAGINFKF